MKDNLVIELLSSGGKISTKRVVTVGLLSLITLCTIVELFTSLKVSDNTFGALTYSFDAAVASVLIEKFSKKTEKSKDEND